MVVLVTSEALVSVEVSELVPSDDAEELSGLTPELKVAALVVVEDVLDACVSLVDDVSKTTDVI